MSVKGGGKIEIQQVQPGQRPQPTEYRKLVYSHVNKNPKIELNGVKTRVNSGNDEKPIIIFERISQQFYRYMIILPGEQGYSELSNELLDQPRQRSPAWLTDHDSLIEVWDEYPH